ncbi:MarR family transcriptional regulator [Microbispora sp. RL4-1S]|uniref:MarR family transcriptional regulator n=1 Tax=Microbispora oryzae TaxID=2806554 RepID=A0A940WKV0_9ACTN|nr:MarR family transcriptional regulator [Microbispora oryzae]MBP2704748.1 MarR family transcriptional regulator [Microbispora oryzae]
MNDTDSEFVVMAWRELLARHAEVTGALERELSDRHSLGVSEFEVLERLAEGNTTEGCDGAPKFRVQELAAQVHLSQSALSRLIARLEREGLVSRSLCEADRRGVFVYLTDAGRRRHDEAVPTHRGVLSAHLFPHLVNGSRCLGTERDTAKRSHESSTVSSTVSSAVSGAEGSTVSGLVSSVQSRDEKRHEDRPAVPAPGPVRQ